MIEAIILGILVVSYLQRGVGTVVGRFMIPGSNPSFGTAIVACFFWPFVEGINAVITNYNSSQD